VAKLPRIFCAGAEPLAAFNHGREFDLDEAAARHVQVLRMQPADEITLFDGAGGQWRARITDMKRRVAVVLEAFEAVECESAKAIHIALGMPANDNMDWVVEKATELGVVSITPLICERSVLRMRGERADKKLAHWRGVASGAAAQCGRNRVPQIHAVQSFTEFTKTAAFIQGPRFVLSTREGAALHAETITEALFLSGPEGGLTPQEEAAAIDAGFTPTSLGPRILRAETAPLAVLAKLNL
jgi:16S rRNA (uracil1498-N3)-methyltransferase